MSLVHDHLGNAIQGIVANLDMAPSDRLLQVAGELYLYDDNAGKPVLVSSARNLSAGSSGQRILPVAAFRSNGASYDPELGNTHGTLLASAARTATTSTADQTNHNARGVVLFVNVTAASGTGGLTVQPKGKDPVSGGYYRLNAPPSAITGTGLYLFEVYPGASGTGGDVAQRTAGALPRTWAVTVVHGDASAYSYSLGYALIN
jgi:hypothetical protein